MQYRYDEFNNNKYEVHRLAFDLIRENSKVLDIGCATGYFAKELSKRKCETWGVDYDAKAAKKAAKYCKKVVVCNLDETRGLSVPMKYFDYVIVLDVIEHLLHPENVLSIIKKHLKSDGKVIVSIPNIAHASIRWMLLLGRFEYSTTGILDNTHVRFYTIDSIGKLLKKCGYKKMRVIPTNGMCKVPFLYKITDRLPESWQYGIVKKFPSLFAFQYITVTKQVS
ncbi:hypothetical protein A3K29_03425 [Candidatus Collierbacteria bacterium RIFOXYB2_FULL_46_14]|uniref:Methyltransferase type 11 n=1 Tax=Candidatus Collierbacteria bacterium GW2011_GWA2_46_26 TaxID=1618381 RepID=A0A0G1RUW1_9BACT|nr:MAG: Methyltransferase type 11 [Candidatus Collierbacteria bacterium GW2011_GWC2_44_13]KKU33758.1 MAG: Methyltransferase type 11 [Candidatus Collierbacteria bacterium GW2011_GWA2_46_26]OGD73169.1 MAG: hypothetical protein A3K29_03425 [Candidatus Collierbacteria bacterium RIFOXYB2_FULL_46_14]OGD76211.1 MAG: hypothetical protein A3K43_03425 [Candidatus Collierbacteria bacterium RIFOXYA2_FULL_46_20]OGD77547.1 MAG: hypothetical protein A3K39_03425 [Candidatus Collierbacteria bacterium RIFOXYC2_F